MLGRREECLGWMEIPPSHCRRVDTNLSFYITLYRSKKHKRKRKHDEGGSEADARLEDASEHGNVIPTPVCDLYRGWQVDPPPPKARLEDASEHGNVIPTPWQCGLYGGWWIWYPRQKWFLTPWISSTPIAHCIIFFSTPSKSLFWPLRKILYICIAKLTHTMD